MNRFLIPTYVAPSLFSIPFSFYKAVGVSSLILDLDNTLASHREKMPDERALSWAKAAREAGFSLYIVSNNSKKRVLPYAKALGAEGICLAFKPLPFRLLSFIKKKGIEKEEAILLGDQIYTDVLAANRAGLRSVLLAPLVEDDPVWTLLNRRREASRRAEIYAKSLSTPIKEES